MGGDEFKRFADKDILNQCSITQFMGGDDSK